MKNLNMHTPEGTFDVLQKECLVRRRLKDYIMDGFKMKGYQEVETPLFSYFHFEEGNRDESFKIFDEDGEILVLRTDFTKEIARMAATKMNESVAPIKLCYVGQVCRNTKAEGYKLKEWTQAGIELIGTATPLADSEIIAMTIDSLLGSGIDEFLIEIGQANFFKGLIEEAKLSPVDAALLKEYTVIKDSVSIGKLLDGKDIKESVRSILCEIPSLFGGIEIFDCISRNDLSDNTIAALDNLKEVYNILCAFGYEKYISIDLGLVQKMDYYTGIVFNGYTRNMGFSICGGGRYDKLFDKFGASKPAVGVAIGINRLASVLLNQSPAFDDLSAESMVFIQNQAYQMGYEIMKALLEDGSVCELYDGDGSLEEAIRYAEEKGIGGLVIVDGTDEMMLYDVKRKEEKKVSRKELY